MSKYVFSSLNTKKYRTEKTPYLDTFYVVLKKIFNLLLLLKLMNHSAWTVSVSELFRSAFYYIRIRDSPYPSVFSVNAGKYGPDQLRIRTRFYAVSRWKQCRVNAHFYTGENLLKKILTKRILTQSIEKKAFW